MHFSGELRRITEVFQMGQEILFAAFSHTTPVQEAEIGRVRIGAASEPEVR